MGVVFFCFVVRFYVFLFLVWLGRLGFKVFWSVGLFLLFGFRYDIVFKMISVLCVEVFYAFFFCGICECYLIGIVVFFCVYLRYL